MLYHLSAVSFILVVSAASFQRMSSSTRPGRRLHPTSRVAFLGDAHQRQRKRLCRQWAKSSNDESDKSDSSSSKKKRSSSFDMSGFSFVEGQAYDSLKEEVEAMGGDPFFLDDDDTDGGSSSGDNGNKDDAEWDGVEDDTAYFD